MDGPPDIQAKYQKLATEYAKLRAQVGVLKKGVVDEQMKCSGLGDAVKEKDTQIRKQEGEMESVKFRNQQLTKRIDVLQDEIDGLEAKSHKSRWRGSSKDRSNNGDLAAHSAIVSEELVAKITENARLHATLEDIEKQYENTIITLQARIQDLEKEKTQVHMGNKSKERDLSVTVAEVTKEKEVLHRKVVELEKQVASKLEKNVALEVQMEELSKRLEEAEAEIKHVEKTDVETQYQFVDSDAEEIKEQDKVNAAHRLDTALAKVRELEQAREHWKLEFQLLQMKNEKMKNGSSPSSNDLVGDREADEVWALREAELKGWFEEKMCELVSGRLHADSKAVAYFLECEALQRRLARLAKEKGSVDRKLDVSRMEEERMKEDVGTTRENYEGQLSIMSDHLAEMNIKLAEQTDTIQQLKFQLNNKNMKKLKK